MTDQAFIDLNNHITLNIEDDGLKVGLVPHDGGIAILLTLTTDLGRFVVALSPDHLQVLYNVLKNMATLSPEQYQAAYDQILALHQKGSDE